MPTTSYDRVLAVVKTAMEDSFYQGAKGQPPVSESQVTAVVWKIVSVAAQEVRNG